MEKKFIHDFEICHCIGYRLTAIVKKTMDSVYVLVLARHWNSYFLTPVFVDLW